MPKVQEEALKRKAREKFPGRTKQARLRRDRFVFGILENQKKRRNGRKR